MKRIGVTRTKLLVAVVMVVLSAVPSAGSAALSAPTLTAPVSGTALSQMGETLAWNLPPGATQYQLQVVPANNDGPGIDLIRAAAGWFTIPAPPTWYALLPDLTYTWRVRASDKPGFAPPDDPAWGPWSEAWTFHTPSRSSDGIQPVFPPDGAAMDSANPLFVRWTSSDPAVFYFEVQVSRDPTFDTDPATATSFVWWVLRHGGATDPSNSWRVPVLEASSTYYWRVRPRVQGDGTPVAWSPTWSFTTPSLLRLAFVSDRDGNEEIYVMYADGSNASRLTTNPAHDRQPVWSPPDAGSIAFASDRDGNWEIYVMRSDGSGQTDLTNSRANEFSPMWSPDGAQIAFVSDRDGNSDLYLMNRDGTGVTRLTSGRTDNIQPAWSPDGSQITFASNRDGNWEIYLMRADGTGPTRLTTSPAQDSQPSWSQDGSWIAFVSDRDGNAEIYLMHPDGNGQTRLTTDRANEASPTWPPGDTRIAFSSDRDAGSEIYIMNPDGSGPTSLTAKPNNGWSPAWSQR